MGEANRAYSYLYLIGSVRESRRVKQRVVKNLVREDAVVASGKLDRLVRSIARLARHSLVLSLLGDAALARPSARRIGAALLFERLWWETGC